MTNPTESSIHTSARTDARKKKKRADTNTEAAAAAPAAAAPSDFAVGSPTGSPSKTMASTSTPSSKIHFQDRQKLQGLSSLVTQPPQKIHFNQYESAIQLPMTRDEYNSTVEIIRKLTTESIETSRIKLVEEGVDGDPNKCTVTMTSLAYKRCILFKAKKDNVDCGEPTTDGTVIMPSDQHPWKTVDDYLHDNKRKRQNKKRKSPAKLLPSQSMSKKQCTDAAWTSSKSSKSPPPKSPPGTASKPSTETNKDTPSKTPKKKNKVVTKIMSPRNNKDGTVSRTTTEQELLQAAKSIHNPEKKYIRINDDIEVEVHVDGSNAADSRGTLLALLKGILMTKITDLGGSIIHQKSHADLKAATTEEEKKKVIIKAIEWNDVLNQCRELGILGQNQLNCLQESIGSRNNQFHFEGQDPGCLTVSYEGLAGDKNKMPPKEFKFLNHLIEANKPPNVTVVNNNSDETIKHLKNELAMAQSKVEALESQLGESESKRSMLQSKVQESQQMPAKLAELASSLRGLAKSADELAKREANEMVEESSSSQTSLTASVSQEEPEQLEK